MNRPESVQSVAVKNLLASLAIEIWVMALLEISHGVKIADDYFCE